MAVADAYSAMTTDRPYRKGMERGRRRCRVLEQGAGTQWDPDCVDAFLRVRRQPPALRKRRRPCPWPRERAGTLFSREIGYNRPYECAHTPTSSPLSRRAAALPAAHPARRGAVRPERPRSPGHRAPCHGPSPRPDAGVADYVHLSLTPQTPLLANKPAEAIPTPCWSSTPRPCRRCRRRPCFPTTPRPGVPAPPSPPSPTPPSGPRSMRRHAEMGRCPSLELLVRARPGAGRCTPRGLPDG